MRSRAEIELAISALSVSHQVGKDLGKTVTADQLALAIAALRWAIRDDTDQARTFAIVVEESVQLTITGLERRIKDLERGTNEV